MNWKRQIVTIMLGVGLAMTVAQHANATTSATLQLGNTLQYDDNVFRLEPGALQPGLKYTDDLDKIMAGFFGGFSSSSFSGTLNGDLNKTFFKNNTFLNNTGFDLAATGHKDGDIFSDDLTITSSRQLSSFEYVQDEIKNIQTVTRVTNEARYTVANYFRLVVDGNFLKTDNSAPDYTVNNVQEYGGGVGIGYYSPTQNYINVIETFNDERGENSTLIVLNQMPATFRTNFTEAVTTLNIFYVPSPISSLTGNIGYTERFDHSVLKDSVDGITGNLSFAYHPSDYFSTVFHLVRQFSAETYLFTDSIIFSGADLTVKKFLTPQIYVTLHPYYNEIYYKFFLQAGSDLSDRTDKVYGGTIALDYAFRDLATLELLGRHEQRTSNMSGFAYTDNGIALSIKFNLGSHDLPATQGTPFGQAPSP